MTTATRLCEVCGGDNLSLALDLGSHPLCDDLVPVGDTRVCKLYPIEILICPDCITAHQRFQVPKAELFPASYHYRSRFTADVLNGMRSLVATCEARLGSLAGKTVLDIGCNDGSLLDFFCEKGCKTVGIEPTGAADDALAKDHRIYKNYFTPESAATIRRDAGQPDIITFTNVFAHIEDLPSLLQALGLLIGPETLLVIENHYFGAVLDRFQFDTFYHEHPRTYSLTSFLKIAQTMGLDVLSAEFPARYGGNIRVMLGKGGGGLTPEVHAILEREKDFPERLRNFTPHIERWQASMKQKIAELAATHGPLTAKAFPGRAAILIRLLDLDETLIAATHEKPGSMKIDHYIPGTRIPIRSDDQLFAEKTPLVVLNFAWHIAAEIRTYLQEHGCTAPVIDILDPQQFVA